VAGSYKQTHLHPTPSNTREFADVGVIFPIFLRIDGTRGASRLGASLENPLHKGIYDNTIATFCFYLFFVCIVVVIVTTVYPLNIVFVGFFNHCYDCCCS
jgi:hypothetical protein